MTWKRSVTRAVALLGVVGLSVAWLSLAPYAAAQQMKQPQPGQPRSTATVPAVIPPRLSRAEAERIALANNPRTRIGDLLAKVQSQVVRETQSANLPQLNGSATAVDTVQDSRLGAGVLPASRLLQHAGIGLQLSQLITDFGRTHNLVASARFQERASQSDAVATQQDVVLATDQIYFQALQAQAALQVADQTVQERQTLVDQVSALTSSKLKSDLDLSFAKVNLSEAKLLRVSAANNLDAAKASLVAVLGFDQVPSFNLVDEDITTLPSLPATVDPGIQEAIAKRPDLESLRLAEQAAQSFSAAQRDQYRPTISALGVTGMTPWRPGSFFSSSWYGAAGVNIDLPIFNGFRIPAQVSQAVLQATVQREKVRDLRNSVVRDVRVAWLKARADRERVGVSNDLLNQANTALGLAETRYRLGLSSIVELSQAQLQQVQAAMENANANAEYGLSYSAYRYQTGAAIP